MATSDDLRIGDFSRPVVDAPKPGTSPTKERLDALEGQLEGEANKAEASLKPMASYEERLREVGVTRAKAAEVIDAVLLKGSYSEDIPLTKSIMARFRTRNARDTKRAQEQIEAMRLSYDVHYNEAMARLLLAASLERFGDDTFKHPMRTAPQGDIEKSFFDRLTYVDGLSDPAMRLLLTKLSKFDRMVSVVLEEGSIENF